MSCSVYMVDCPCRVVFTWWIVRVIVSGVCCRVCVGIKVEPAESDNWYCPRCMLKQKGNKKKKQRRKKSR